MKRTHFIYLVMFLAAGLVFFESIFVQQAQAATLVVTTTNDNGNNSSPTPGSLRQAIIIANGLGGLDTINFNIPANSPGCNSTTNVCTITPPVPLPDITSQLSINGYTQPGASANSLLAGTNAVLRIELNGANAGAGANGLTIDSIACTVKGLIINRFNGSAIRLQKINQVVEGNFIGTDATGTVDLGNANGVTLVSADNSFIGGGGFTSRNLISGNGVGINLLDGDGIIIKGELIGTTANGTNPLGNSTGVRIGSTAANNTIGAPFNGEGNTIAFNTGGGIQVIGSAAGNRIRGNSIHSNQAINGTGLGIDLGNDFITLNDALDSDTGTNNFQNFPDLLSATVSGNSTVIQGRLNSTPNAAFNIDFYSNATCEISGYGEGQTYIGSTTAMTDSFGTITFNATLAVNTAGKIITATATDSVNNTSEFSGCLAAGAPTTIQVTTTADNGSDGNPTPGSLRAAFRDSNNLGGLKTITFNIPASDPNCNATTNVCAIQLAAALQNLTAPVVIDGWSQGGAGYTGSPLIELNRSLTIKAGSSTIQGLVIKGGIILQTFGVNVVRGNYIGTDASGLNRIGNSNGIVIQTPENIIGGTNPAARNLISGSNGSGILIQTLQAQGNIIQGNFIGTDKNGANPNNVMGNLSNGIRIDTGASNNTIGGTSSGAGNLIAFNGFNGGAGIHINNGTGNSIRGNSIRDNPGLGIDLADGLVTQNDLGDSDAGANNLQNFPVINSAQRISGGNTTTAGTLNSTPNTQFAIDFFSNTTCDDSENGEGAIYLGSQVLTTDSGGNASYYVTLSIASGSQFVTATATKTATGDTSEFSACRSISPINLLEIKGQITLDGNPLPGVTVSLSGSATATTTTDSAGNFSFADLTTNGNYTVTPSLASYTFSPSSAAFNNLAANQIANFTATQCAYSIAPNGVNAPAANSTGSFTVTAPAGCSWTAVANHNWLAVTSGAQGTGGGAVGYSVTANTTVQRTGSITVEGLSFLVTQSGASHSISGAAMYGTTPANLTPKFVSGVLMSVAGDSSASTATDSSGAYLVENLTSGGAYTVTPSKTGNVNGISAFDATLILRCVAAGNGCALTDNQKLAADSNADNSISAFDATQILRFVAANGANANTGKVGTWKFSPAQLSYSSLNDSHSGENYTAILIGEINGDWSPIASAAFEDEEIEQEKHPQKKENFISPNNEESFSPGLQLALLTNAAETDGSTILIPVVLTNKNGAQISSFNFDVIFPDASLQIINPIIVTTGALSRDCAIVSDTNTPGRVGIAAACASGITASGSLLHLRFKIIGKENIVSGKPALTFGREPLFEDNNGNIVSVKNINLVKTEINF